jgi:hypothetical protein
MATSCPWSPQWLFVIVIFNALKKIQLVIYKSYPWITYFQVLCNVMILVFTVSGLFCKMP